MNKPLHKDPSFWIVAVTLVVAADAAQFHFGSLWFAQKLAQRKPAPRVALNSSTGPTYSGQRRNPPHAPGEWRLPYFEPNILQNAGNIVAILPTKFEMPSGGWTADNPPAGGWTTWAKDKAIGVRLPAEFVIQLAYSWNSKARTVYQDRPPFGHYDFIANLPAGALKGLQNEIRRQWGLIAERENFHTNALVLVVSRPDILKPHDFHAPMRSQPNTINFGSVPNMVSFLESAFNTPILDHTDLSGIFDLSFPMTAINRPRIGGQSDERTATVKKILEDQFGLDLIKTNAPVEMLVVKKVSVAGVQQKR